MAERLFRIPLTNEPQTFDIDLVGRTYTITCRWNGQMPAWQICMRDAITEEVLLTCMPLVTGTDLLAQYRYKEIPGQLFCYTEGDEFAPPTLENLGTEGLVFYLVEDEA